MIKEFLNYALIIPDCHVPYHNQRAVGVMLQVAQSLGTALKEIVILGDFGDFYAVSSHTKSPAVSQILTDEIREINLCLDVLDVKFPDQKKVYLEGNHEFRLERYILQNAPGLFGVTETQFLMNLNRRPNWQFVKYGMNQYHKVLGTKLYARHEPYSMSSAGASLKNSNCNLVYGHIHKREMASGTLPCGERMYNFSPGWLGDVRKTEVFGFCKKRPNWDLGFAVVAAKPGEQTFYFENVEFDNNLQVNFRGRTYAP